MHCGRELEQSFSALSEAKPSTDSMQVSLESRSLEVLHIAEIVCPLSTWLRTWPFSSINTPASHLTLNLRQLLYLNLFVMVPTSLFLGPLVLRADGLLLLGGQIVVNVERLANLLGGLALHKARYLGTAQFQQRLDVQVVCRANQIKQLLLDHVNEIRIPLFDHFAHVGRLERHLNILRGVVDVILHVHYNLVQDRALDVHHWDLVVFHSYRGW